MFRRVLALWARELCSGVHQISKTDYASGIKIPTSTPLPLSRHYQENPLAILVTGMRGEVD